MALTSMMTQYLKKKEEYKDCILFYRLGDFYEMFFDDAILVSKELELTLTGRDCGLEERAPMCGIPFHAASSYIDRLVSRGYKVAICEQLEDPALAKGLVKRDVIQVITPGTITEGSNLDGKKNNYIVSVYVGKYGQGICYADITTGDMAIINSSNRNDINEIEDNLVRIGPSEIICNDETKRIYTDSGKMMSSLPKFNTYNEWSFGLNNAEKISKKHFGVANLSVFGIQDAMAGICAMGALIEYLNDTQKRTLSNINKVRLISGDDFMNLDASTRRHLELTENMNTHKKQGSILNLLDYTKTSMGARKLRNYVSQPLTDSDLINARLDSVEELVNNNLMRENLQAALAKIYDIERISGRIAYGSILPKECLSLVNSLKMVPFVKQSLLGVNAELLKQKMRDLIDLKELTLQIDEAIDPNCTMQMKDGGYIKTGYSKELDELRNASESGKRWVAEYESRERERTGIKTLRVGFNKVFGYYIELTKAYLNDVPMEYIRKQTTVNTERYISPELKEIEEKILGSGERAIKLESELYQELRQMMLSYVSAIQSIADSISVIDCLCSFATAAIKHNYVKPKINNSIDEISILEGRHPVVESLMTGGGFVPNDTHLDGADNRTMVITGPNMAGKSTYMRQVAVICLMAQMGCFVPATEAKLSIVDKIFTRIGASDDLSAGQSTFMVEMMEVAHILNNATSKSLLILDEVGRGTSTYDGLSIAWAIMEYLSVHLKAKTLFSTHYHELCELEGKCDGVKNYRVMIKEFNNSIIFLHKIARGSANRSFGIEVASLAGLPADLVNRAKEILKIQESRHITTTTDLDNKDIKYNTSANISEVINILKEMDMNTISPIMAFGTLQNLVDKVKK